MYRSTPHATTWETPAYGEIFLGHDIRNQLGLIKPGLPRENKQFRRRVMMYMFASKALVQEIMFWQETAQLGALVWC